MIRQLPALSSLSKAARRGALVGLGLLSLLALFASLAPSASAAGTTYYVNGATGSDTNTCLRSGGGPFPILPGGGSAGPNGPCKTISAAVAKAGAGDTVQVASGTYNEPQINITEPITLRGAGAASTIIDGGNATIASNTGGLIRINEIPQGNVTIQGFTLEGAGMNNQAGEPFLILVEGAQAGSTYTITQNVFLENTTLDPNLSTDFSVGMYSLASAATFSITNNQAKGMFQAIFLEESTGTATISQNTITDLLASGGYAPEGIIILADGGSNITNAQSITNNTLQNYAGLGIAVEAGYTPANQTGNASDVIVTGNNINLQGATDVEGASEGIAFRTAANSTISGVTLQNNQIQVTAPSTEMKIDGLGSVSFSEID